MRLFAVVLVALFVAPISRSFGQNDSVYPDDRLGILPVWSRIADYSDKLRSVECAEISPDGRYAFSAAKFGYQVMMWDVRDGSIRWESKHDSEVECVCWSPRGRWVASGGEDYTVRVWNAKTGEPVQKLSLPRGPDGLAWSGDGKTLAAGTEGGEVVLFDTESWTVKNRIPAGSTVNSVQFIDGDQRVLVGGNIQTPSPADPEQIDWSGFALLCDVDSTEPAWVFRSKAGSIKSVRKHPTESWVATAGFDFSVHVLDLADGTVLQKLESDGRFEAVEFSPDGKLLLAGGHHGYLSVYRVADWKLIDKVPMSSIEYLHFSRDGRLLLTSHEDTGMIRLFVRDPDLQRHRDDYSRRALQQLNNRDMKPGEPEGAPKRSQESESSKKSNDESARFHRPIQLEPIWERFADPAGADPDDPTLSMRSEGDGYETDRGEVGGESAVISSDSRLVVTASRSNARRTHDTPALAHKLNQNTSHVRLWDIDGNLLWDRGRSRGADERNNRTGEPGGDGFPDDLPEDFEDEIEHAAFTTHASNRDRYVVAGGEDDKIEVWEIRDDEGNTLSEPNLVRTLPIPGGRDAAFDSLGFSTSGELLIGGTEYHGHVEFWRATGDPSTWQHVGHASHGGAIVGKAVNEFDLSPDDRFMVTAGTDQNGGFWRVNMTRDPASGEITAVSCDRLAVMPQPVRSSKAARIENRTGRHAVIASKDQRMFVFDTSRLKQGDITPVVVLNNGLYHGVDRMTGVEIEPADYSRSGRFLVQGGGPEERFDLHPNTADYRSSFFRIFDTTQFIDGGPEPDPIFVQPAYHSEFFHFSEDDSLLSTSHDDGTVRLWRTNITDARTIAAESFNERSDRHERWTLSGPGSTTEGGDDWGVTHLEPPKPEFKPMPVDVPQAATWVGLRGARFLAADDLGGEEHAWQNRQPFDLAGYDRRLLLFAAAGRRGVYDKGDRLVVSADTDGDGSFETELKRFEANERGDLCDPSGKCLTPIFDDFVIDLESRLPQDFGGKIDLRVTAVNSGKGKEMAFDSIRLTGFRINR